jgi:hypothetical protein
MVIRTAESSETNDKTLQNISASLNLCVKNFSQEFHNLICFANLI